MNSWRAETVSCIRLTAPHSVSIGGRTEKGLSQYLWIDSLGKKINDLYLLTFKSLKLKFNLWLPLFVKYIHWALC